MKRYRTYPVRNHSAGLEPMRARGFVWHTTEGHGMAYLLSLLSGEVARDDGVRPSVHFLISLKGDIWELAPWRPGEAFVCWHAGTSAWENVTRLNRCTLGVEIEHVGSETYPEVQAQACERLATAVATAYRGTGLMQWGILEHKQIAPKRKSDPTGPWAPVKARILAAWTAAWNEIEEEDMTSEQDARMKRIELSEFARSFDVAVLKLLIAGETAAAAQTEEAKATAVAAKRKALGLS